MSLSFLRILIIAILGLIGVGFYGLLISQNLIKVVIALQILVKGALLALVAAGAVQGQVYPRPKHGADRDCRRYDRGSHWTGAGCSGSPPLRNPRHPEP